MITPKQIDNSQAGPDRSPPRGKKRNTRSDRRTRQLRREHREPAPDSFFNALREELGL